MLWKGDYFADTVSGVNVELRLLAGTGMPSGQVGVVPQQLTATFDAPSHDCLFWLAQTTCQRYRVTIERVS
jgi:hypothetical protein